jgi:hypothetical protein
MNHRQIKRRKPEEKAEITIIIHSEYLLAPTKKL